LLAEQERALWDKAMIARGLPFRPVGRRERDQRISSGSRNCLLSLHRAEL
jgi:predicted RNA polymerase sigma factor